VDIEIGLSYLNVSGWYFKDKFGWSLLLYKRHLWCQAYALKKIHRLTPNSDLKIVVAWYFKLENLCRVTRPAHVTHLQYVVALHKILVRILSNQKVRLQTHLWKYWVPFVVQSYLPDTTESLSLHPLCRVYIGDSQVNTLCMIEIV
jgi:hypothetical protein